MTLLYVFLVSFVIWIIFKIRYFKREQKLYQTALTDSFKTIVPAPQLKTRNSYGFPSFEVTFKNETLLKQAEDSGLTQNFIERIKQIHFNFKKFDAERAIYFTWEGRTHTIISPDQQT
ncbi:hypothetical protein SAMN05421640_0003 [Ekhidna lutea]|uniref:Uncharacterized protein n=1 Tax=Ekhidna lutea TaxID=447679 RepID=A0A239MCV4_EKHLU|nr:hypothetical protein [Ekhidna lutea]SNT40565.1 hypothetical protein SAMN05421640_0003 [Ekhidna lutea]